MNMDSYEKQAEGQSGRGELVRLDSVSMDEDDEILPDFEAEVGGGFTAMVNGEQMRVRAVQERTVVIEHHEGGERSVVRKDNCMVQPSAVAFVPGNPNNGVGPRQWRRLPGKPPAPAKQPSCTPTTRVNFSSLLWRALPSSLAP